MTRKKWVAVICAQLATLVLVGWLWQNVSKNQAIFLSRPTDIFSALWKWITTPSLLAYIPVTLGEAGAGLAVALVVAVFFASVLSSSRALARIFVPIVSVLNAVPKIALAPLFLLLFGLGFKSKMYFVAAGVAFVPFYSLFAALTSIDATLLDNARMLGAGRRQRIREIYLPAVIGASAVSLRLATAFALLGAIFAELIASQSGIGYELLQAENNTQPNFELAGILIVAFIAFILDRLTVLVQRRFVHWQVSA